MDYVTKRESSEFNDAPAPLDDTGPTPPQTPQAPPPLTVPPPAVHARATASPSAHRQRSPVGDVDPFASQPDSVHGGAAAPNGNGAEEAAPPSADRPGPPVERPADGLAAPPPRPATEPSASPSPERGLDPVAEAGQRPSDPFTPARARTDHADDPTNEQRQTSKSSSEAPQRPGTPAGGQHAAPGERAGTEERAASWDSVSRFRRRPTLAFDERGFGGLS